MVDLPDYYTQAAIAEAEAAGLKGGLDANKADDPVSRDIYLATDTHILYVCFTDGDWTGFDASILTQGTLTLYEHMAAGGKKIENLADPTAAQDAATRAYVLSRTGLYLPLAGGTMAGDIQLGANKLRTTNLLLHEVSSDYLYLLDSTGASYRHFVMGNLLVNSALYMLATGYGIYAPNSDGAYSTLKARDTGNALVDIAKLQGAADPYFELTLPPRFLPASEPGAVLEGMAWYDAEDDIFKYRDAASTKRLTPTKELFIPSNSLSTTGDATAYGDFGVVALSAGEHLKFTFKVPHDFTALTHCKIVGIVDLAGQTIDWTTTTTFGKIGEQYNAHSDSDTEDGLAVTQGELEEIDVSAALTGLAADDFVGLEFTADAFTGGADFAVLGLVFRYT